MASTPYNPYGPPKKSSAPRPPAPIPPSSGSSPAPKYGPKTPLPPKPLPPGYTHREALYPGDNNRLLIFKDSIYDGLVMASGILLATFLVRQIKKDMAPQLTIKNASSLAIVTILSDYLIDYGKRYDYIPYKIM